MASKKKLKKQIREMEEQIEMMEAVLDTQHNIIFDYEQKYGAEFEQSIPLMPIVAPTLH